jgi:quercetin dioxygenase-like cupin family protein
VRVPSIGGSDPPRARRRIASISATSGTVAKNVGSGSIPASSDLLLEMGASTIHGGWEADLMDELASGAKVIRGTDGAPLNTFAELFGVPEDAIHTFPFRIPAQETISTHRHTGPLAARVNAGAMTFVIGDPPDERVDLEAGDYVWVPEGLPHEEIVGANDDVDLLVAHLGAFETEPA